MIHFSSLENRHEKIAVVGLGYVGLPLAVALSKYFQVVGFDVNQERIGALQSAIDKTGEVSENELKATSLTYASDPVCLKNCKFLIVAVPTPVRKGNIPDLGLVERASAMIGQNLGEGSIIVYESTVYPGVTEDVCLPIIEKNSGLKAGVGFKLGYSPERINPGDKEHTIHTVTKIVSGMDAETLEVVSKVYGKITKVYEASSIKVAEAAKVIENTQRDVNIALMNELAVIFSKMHISTYEVLKAASTKWNFLPFTPGLVGGHCIGVDPYYLTYKAETLGYHPEVILSGRKINDGMGTWIVSEVFKKMIQVGKNLKEAKILLIGMTFKENVPDVRNARSFDIYKEILSYGITPIVYDPIADGKYVKHEYNIDLITKESLGSYDAVFVAVSHAEIKNMALSEWQKMLKPNAFVADIKNILKKDDIEKQGWVYWTL